MVFFTVGYGYFVIGQMLRLKHFIYAAIRLPHRLHLEVVRGKVFPFPGLRLIKDTRGIIPVTLKMWHAFAFIKYPGSAIRLKSFRFRLRSTADCRGTQSYNETWMTSGHVGYVVAININYIDSLFSLG